MHRAITLTGAVLLVTAACQLDASEDYSLVWSDEFDVDGPPDPGNWTFEKGFVRNEEEQWYQPENARCEDGLLIIEARRERIRNPNYDAQHIDWARVREYAEYSSASLNTRGLQSWQFGRFEIRAKIDTGPGLWPAFWTLGTSGRWPHNGEVDIMEYYKGTVLANVAWGDRKVNEPIWDTQTVALELLQEQESEWRQKFHIWRMDWDSESIRLYLDGELVNVTDLSETYNRDEAGKNPFLQPHYILLNLAIGGTAGGDPAGTSFPAYYEIDYVRVYQK